MMKKKSLENIDSSLSLMGEFSEISLGTTQAIQALRQKVIFTDGVLPAKMKALAATLWSVSVRCEPCLKYYAVKAKVLGTSEEELGEILAVASTMGGCVGEMWALKAFQAYREEVESSESCCSHHESTYKGSDHI